MKETSVSLTINHTKSRLLHSYADWRIKPTLAEKHCHKTSSSILLTFDDFGSESEINNILTTLKLKGVKAAFFIQGDWAEKNSDLLDKLSQDGHIVGNHTYSHPDLMTLSDEEVIKEIRKGLSSPWFRPPRGRYDKRVRSLAESEGRSICYWTIDSQDWAGESVRSIRHTIFSELKPGAVILFHLHAAQTPGLLADLIDDIRSRGYQLTPFTENWTPKN